MLWMNALQSFGQNPGTASSADILLQMKKLNVLGSVLYIAAHPDDENNALLPYLANETLYRTAYLSLTRGDGGQNLIGDEQGVELGLIRTQELLAARRIDGAEQYFTRAYEFGFSKSAEEALKIWNKEKILSDVVWIIRKYQPDIIIKRFPPDKRAGHGHHAASAILADEAFTAAADPNRFPEQFNYGVKPWQAKRILWNTYNFGNNNTTGSDQLKIDIGGYNPLLGKSYGELGGEARTMHKSQGEGRPRRRGESYEYFKTTAGPAAIINLMDGINIDWSRLPGGEGVSVLINEAIQAYNPSTPELSVPALLKIYKAIKALPDGVWRNKKLAETQQLIMECSALYLEATTAMQTVTQGGDLKISITANARESDNVVLKSIRIEDFDTTLTTKLSKNQNVSINTLLHVADDKAISQPYWLTNPVTEGIFDVRDQTLIGKPENDPAFCATITVGIDGEDFVFNQPLQYRVVDPVKGDLYEPVVVLPKTELDFTGNNFISINDAPVKIAFRVKSEDTTNLLQQVHLYITDSWKSVNKPQVNYQNNGHEYTITDFYKPSSAFQNKKETISLETTGEKYDGYSKTIAYDHIPTITYFPRAQANLVSLHIKLSGKKIGYFAGAGDKVPAALQAMGYEVVFLNENDINDARLAQFDAIITGIRAYNLYAYLTDKNEVMNRYVHNGGNLIIQYMKSNFAGQEKINAGPYAFSIDAGTRVTEEDAKVDFLLPDNVALHYPNTITDKDFDGWVQERSTYQAVKLDEHFVMPLGMHDKEDKETSGSLAIAKYGKGNVVYASLTFFRQLPAGVPGAYRLMANLIALPKNK